MMGSFLNHVFVHEIVPWAEGLLNKKNCLEKVPVHRQRCIACGKIATGQIYFDLPPARKASRYTNLLKQFILFSLLACRTTHGVMFDLYSENKFRINMKPDVKGELIQVPAILRILIKTAKPIAQPTSTLARGLVEATTPSVMCALLFVCKCFFR